MWKLTLGYGSDYVTSLLDCVGKQGSLFTVYNFTSVWDQKVH
jgi:hypothetical protein